MKCRDCGQDGFTNIGEVNRHKANDCPARTAAVEDSAKEPASIEAIQRMAKELGYGVMLVKSDRFLVIPKRFLPDEVKYLGPRAYMGIKMRGYLDENGLVVQEPTERIR